VLNKQRIKTYGVFIHSFSSLEQISSQELKIPPLVSQVVPVWEPLVYTVYRIALLKVETLHWLCVYMVAQFQRALKQTFAQRLTVILLTLILACLQHSKFNIVFKSHRPFTVLNASLVVRLHVCAVACALKEIFAQCKIFLEGTLVVGACTVVGDGRSWSAIASPHFTSLQMLVNRANIW